MQNDATTINIGIVATDESAAVLREATANVGNFSGTVADSTGSLGAFTDATTTMQGKVAELGGVVDGTTGQIGSMGGTATATAGELDAVTGAAEGASGALASVKGASMGVNGSLETGAASAATSSAAMNDAASAGSDLSGSMGDVAIGAETAESRTIGMGEAVKNTILPLAEMFGVYMGGKEAITQISEATQTFQQNNAQLQAILKNTNDAIGMSVDQLDDLAESTSKNTTIASNSNLTVEQTLLGYSSLNKAVLPQSISLVDDLATRMAKGGTPSTQQLSAAAKELGKALQDPASGTNAFTKAMVTFTPAQQDAIKAMAAAGNQAGAQKLIMQDLSGAVGGDATAATETFRGKIAELNNQLEPLKIRIGTDVEGALESLGETFVKVTSWVEDHRKGLQQVLGILGPLAAGALAVMAAIKIWKTAVAIIDGIKAAVIALNVAVEANPWAILAAIVIGVVLLILTHWNTVKQWFSDFIDWLKAHWELIIEILLGPVGIAIVEIVKHFDDIKQGFNDIIQWFKDVVDFGKLLYDAGKQIIQGMINGIKDAVGDLKKAVEDVGKDAVNAAKSVLKIFSPSRVFDEEVGQQIGAGLTQGVQKSKAGVVAATSDMARSSITAAQAIPVPSLGGSQVNNNVTNANTYGGNSSANITIQNLNLNTASATQAFLSGMDNDTLLYSKGLTPARGNA